MRSLRGVRMHERKRISRPEIAHSVEGKSLDGQQPCNDQALGDRQGGGEKGDLVGGDASPCQPVGKRPQSRPEGRFQRIERRHVRTPRPQLKMIWQGWSIGSQHARAARALARGYNQQLHKSLSQGGKASHGSLPSNATKAPVETTEAFSTVD
ncbi:hypothetical protein MESS2_730035 [Mesorhizobium metallidurans STM 2683]|uniref:Uncharacterized protein n=1 Tax=Mesorhizobium metallidurans STM 2683 TaxID=1297569 RepID=M5ET48_9HYPH|nr:hypothetical protein MESS2_730035 [Mesorhizobium metallidurans STM 2683]